MKREIINWFLDLISPWFIPRCDYDERLARINLLARENHAMLLVHHDYVEAQLRAPDLTRVLLEPNQAELYYYKVPQAWPPLWSDPNILDLKMHEVRQERVRLQRYYMEMTVDDHVLAHYHKYSGGLFRTIATRVIHEMCMKLIKLE